MEENKLIKRVKINQFLDNFGVFNWSIFYISWTFTFISFISILLTISYALEFGLMDYYKIMGAVEKDLVYFYNYIMTNTIASLNSFNYINEFVHYKVFNFNIQSTSIPKLSLEGYIILLLSLILTFKVYILSLYQFYIQRKIRNLGFMNYFVPYVFLFKFFRRKKNKYVYIKLLDTLKLEPFNPTNKAIKDIILQLFFEIDIKDCEKYTIQIIVKSMFGGWYNYQIWQIIDDPKYKKDQEKAHNDDKKPTKKSSASTSKNLTRAQKKALKEQES